MTKLQKKLKKGAKRLDKKVINNKKGLTLMQTFDITTSFYGRKQVKKPYVTLTARGDFKISVVKLLLCLLLGISLIALTVLCLRALFDRRHVKKSRRADGWDYDFESDYDIGDSNSSEEELPF